MEHAPANQGIELLAPSGDSDDTLADLSQVKSSDKRARRWLRRAVSAGTVKMARRKTHQTLSDSLLDLVDFGLAESFDVLKLPLGGYIDRLKVDFVSARTAKAVGRTLLTAMV